MRELKAIILDFDGVILESVDVKGWAFGELFKDYPQFRDQIIEYHFANGGVSRYKKIKYIYKEFLNESLSEEKFVELCEQYSQLVFDRVLASDFVPGAEEFLKEYYRDVSLFIVSGTPQEEIRKIVVQRQLAPYFKDVFGSPKDKDYWTGQILSAHQYSSDEVLWVGDAMSDLNAAEKFNIQFVGRVTENRDIFKERTGFHKILNLVELDSFLKEQCFKVKEV